MVRRYIRYDGAIRRKAHSVKLKTGKLENGKVTGAHFTDLRKKRRADISSEKYTLFRVFRLCGKHFGD